MKHSWKNYLRRIVSAALTLSMGVGLLASSGLATLAVSAASDVGKDAPGGRLLVSKGAAVSISACTNERKGQENSYEMPSEAWAKALLTDGQIGNGGWSCQPYDREMDHTKPVTVTLKLPELAEISAVSLYPCGQFPNRYEILTSSDGVHFQKVAEDAGVAIGNKTVKTYEFAATQASHVRLHILERNPATGRDGALAQLGELAVWGVAEPALRLCRPALELLVGEQDTLKATVSGSTGTPAVTFASSDPAVAAVDASGRVTAKAIGTATVTASCAALGLSTSSRISVVADAYDFNENINLSVFWPPTPDYITDEQYKLMADAGINWVMGAGEESLATPENQQRMLELCAKYGMGLTVQDGQFGDNLIGKSAAEIAAYVEKYRNVPAAYGFYLKDEPFNPNKDYVDAYINLKKAAPDASVHLNFLPSAAYGSEAVYKAQMNDWCRLTAAAGYPVEYLMFDRYPFGLQAGTMDRQGFFANVRSCYEVGLANHVKTGMYIQTVCQEVAFRRPTASEIRYEMYAALAFGYKQLSFFTWFTPVDRSEPFRDGIISPDGKPNAHYEAVSQINHEILAIGEVLARCDAQEVYFSGPDTYGQPAVPADFFVQARKGDSAILSYLRHKDTGRGYLMVVNNNYSAARRLVLTFDGAIHALSEVSRTDGSLCPLTMEGRKLTLELAAGDAMLIALPEDFAYGEAPAGQPAATVNLAADATVTCLTSEGEGGWYMYNLTDGHRITGSGSDAKGWRTASHEDSCILVDLGRPLEVNRIDLYAAGSIFDYGVNFPTDIALSVSTDGETYTAVKSFEGLEPARLQGNSLTFDKQTARYIRLDLSGIPRREGYAALNELEVYCDDGSLPAPESFTLTGKQDTVVDYTAGENIALGKEAFASSTTPDETFKQWGWSLEYINDGKATNGWTSNVGRNPGPDATELVGIDLGDIFALEEVVVVPNGAFPIDYVVDVSLDGLAWTAISTVKNAGQETRPISIRPDEPVPARFVRLSATRLRSGGNAADGYLLQLGEIEAYGQPICDKARLQAAVEIYKTEGGDITDGLYTAALGALDNPLLTQSRANDFERKLLSAVGKTPEVTPPESETTVSAHETTHAPADGTTASSEEPVTPPADDTMGTSSAETSVAASGGCSSAASAVALLTLLAGGLAFWLLRRRWKA